MKKDVKEVEEVKEANAGVSSGADSCGVAAFFDLDGTLTALPSLEQRFFRILRQRKEISRRNYLLWLKEAARLAPSGIQEMLQVNKMYLREVRTIRDFRDEDSGVCSSLKSGHGNKRLTTASSQRDSGCAQRDPRLPVPVFFGEAVDRVAWHAKQGHAIVLVSGTLEPLARETARDLEAELAARDLAVTIRVCATRLEEIEDRWTGNILGEAMRGHAKARAARRLAAELGFDLAKCFAYGDNASDAWLLASVGTPAAVNPSSELGKIARMQNWPTLRWTENRNSTRRSQSLQSGKSSSERKKLSESELGEREDLEDGQFRNAVAVSAEDQGSLG